ncbi:hypothetical protein [Microbacterium sp. NPDC055683]
MDAVAVDLDPLRRPAGLRDIGAYERLCGIPWYRRLAAVATGMAAATVAVAAGVWAASVSGLLAQAPVIAVVVVGYAALGAWAFIWWATELGRRVKLASFAWANGWAYADVLEHTRRPGSAFTRVLRGRERAVVASDDPRLPFELGRHFSLPRGRDEAATVQRPFAFVELPLPRRVPNIVLRNRGRSIIPSLGFGLGNARLELEGGFAKRFLLFAPEGYQEDALYIFTPDLMARVLDLGSSAEIELSGDRLFVYLPHRTRFDRPDTMAAVLVLAEELHRRFAARTERYRDDRATPGGPSVALRGQRLAGGGVPLAGIAATAGVVLLSTAVTWFGVWGAPLLFG